MSTLKKKARPQLYDVVVYDVSTRLIETFVGRDLPMQTGLLSAVRRRDTWQRRVNDKFAVAVVVADKYKSGEILKASDKRL
jgi:uncharacterized protein YijF (DUF1287 family)